MMQPLPQPTDAFAWVQTAQGAALVCRPLEPFAPHFFTTRRWLLGTATDGNAPDAWRQVASAVSVPEDRLARLHQVHGAAAVLANLTLRPSADIVLTRDAATALAIQTADCVPLLVADPRTGGVAAVHAGWRGLAATAPRVVVDELRRQFGSRPDDLIAAAGPSIGACCYEVGADVRAAFEHGGRESDGVARWFFERPQPTTRNPSMAGLPALPRPRHWYFDGWAATRDQLIAAGLRGERIFGAELCTASHGVLCSYRRDGAAAGRMAAVIRSATPDPSPHSPTDPRAR